MSEKRIPERENDSRGSGVIRVLVAESDPVLRNALRKVLEEDGGLCVCGLAADGKEACDLCVREKPDVVLTRVTDGIGNVITPMIKKVLPETRVVFFTMSGDKETVMRAFMSGVDGYLLKGIDDEGLIRVVKNAADGISSMSGEVINMVRPHVQWTPLPDNLTLKDKRIIILVKQGKSNREIADQLYCAVGTVKNDISRLLEKFGIKNRFELAARVAGNDLDE